MDEVFVGSEQAELGIVPRLGAPEDNDGRGIDRWARTVQPFQGHLSLTQLKPLQLLA